MSKVQKCPSLALGVKGALENEYDKAVALLAQSREIVSRF